MNSIVSFATQSSTWYSDSSAIHHIIGNSQIFNTLHHTSDSNLRSTGSHNDTISSIGNIHFRFPNGNVKTILGIMYSPTIQKNLFSVDFIVDQNHSLATFKDVTLRILSPLPPANKA
jgi:hypothetical protein